MPLIARRIISLGFPLSASASCQTLFISSVARRQARTSKKTPPSTHMKYAHRVQASQRFSSHAQCHVNDRSSVGAVEMLETQSPRMQCTCMMLRLSFTKKSIPQRLTL